MRLNDTAWMTMLALGVGTVAILAADAQPLLTSAKAGDARAVRALVARKADVNVAEADGTTALQWAVRSGDVGTVRVLIGAGARVNEKNHYNVSALSLAAEGANDAIVDALLKAGADPKTISGDGETVLMTAARSGNPVAVLMLIKAGADVNAKESLDDETALMLAAGQNHAAAVTVLAEAGAGLNTKSRLREQERYRVNGAVTTYSKGGLVPLHFAARNGAIEAVTALARAGADLNAVDPDGINALMIALFSGQYDTAAALIDLGADVNLADSGGRTALFTAVDMHTLEWRMNRPTPSPKDKKYGPVEVVKRLLEKGANPDPVLTRAIIPVHYYSPGNPNLTAGATPFLKAASTSDLELMKLLVEWGADPYARNKNQTSAMQVAAGLNWRVLGLGLYLNNQEEAIEAIKYLVDDLGFDINDVNDPGETALHGATHRTADRDSGQLIRFLVSHGADLYAKDKQGRTALDLARGVGLSRGGPGGAGAGGRGGPPGSGAQAAAGAPAPAGRRGAPDGAGQAQAANAGGAVGGGAGAGSLQPNPVTAALLEELMKANPPRTTAAAR